MNYSFKHNFNYPFPTPPTGPIPVAAPAAAAVPPTGPMFSPYTYHHHYGPYGRRFARFGLFRRFFWFGIGAGVASWWIRSKERRLAYESRAEAADAAVGSGAAGSASCQGHDGYKRSHSNGGAWGWGGHEWRSARPQEWTQHPGVNAPAASAPQAVPVSTPQAMPTAFPNQAQTQTVAAPVSAAAAPASEIEAQERKPSATPTERRFGGWVSRRARRASESEAQQQQQSTTPVSAPVPAPASPAPAAQSPAATPTTPTIDDLAVIRDTIERVMADKKREVAEVQARAKVEARQYATDKLDRLSVILEGLRENLKNDQVPEDKKLV